MDSDGNRWDDPRAHPILHLLNTNDIGRAEVTRFMDVLCKYHDVAPWERMSNRHCIAVKVGSRDEKSRFVVAMGRAGIEHGLCVYDRFRDFVNAFRPYAPRDTRIPAHGALAVRFRPLTSLPMDDGRIFIECKWPHRESRYPNLLRYFPGKEESPKADDLAWIEAATLAFVELYSKKLADDGEGDFIPVECEIRVKTAIGGDKEVPVFVRYPGGEVPKSQTVLVDMIETLEKAAQNGNFRSGCAAHQDFYKVMQEHEEGIAEVARAADLACAFCGKGPKAPLQCSRCKVARYCGAECQRDDWPNHKYECKRLIAEAEKAAKAAKAAKEAPTSSCCHHHHHH